MKRVLLVVAVLSLVSCHRRHQTDATSGDEEEGTPIRRGSPHAELCTETGDQYLQMPYDTNGDGAADVIRVYLVTPTANQNGSRLGRRIVCREADLNGDAVRDVMRIYDDRGRVAREQQDRDFDGHPDYWEIYEQGQLIRIEEDRDRDTRPDTRIYVDAQGRPERIERDVAGRSTPGNWRADHYEFFADGRLVREGIDLDLDGTIDRWDRDRTYEAEVERAEQAEEEAAPTDGGVEGGIRDGSVRDAGPRDAGVREAGRSGGGVNDARRPATTRP